MSTTLALYWHLSSANKKERIEASVKLIGALERFQAEFQPKERADEDSAESKEKKLGQDLDALNAQDVSYAIRRLVRGLASPRESSRLGFAVALTELLARINTVTCIQIVTLVLDSSKTQGSMTGQEERDVLFARLFGLTSVIQSGLIVRDSPLASSPTVASNPDSFMEVINQLLALGEKRSWLRESAWWTIGLALDALGHTAVPWKEDAFKSIVDKVYGENKVWTPEKVAVTLKLQKYYPSANWRELLSPPFKHSEITHTGNYSVLARILKEVSVDEDEDADLKPKSGNWKPQVHSVWDLLLDDVLGQNEQRKTSFPEFFRILVDESLFSSTSSAERKYWGFQIFQKALPKVSAPDLPMLFTKNFMRSWINHLSNSDRYLHKAAKQVANDIHALVKKDPTVGFALILQLTGVHGSHQFDKLTKTKTVETILTSMDNEGIQAYIKHLLEQVNAEHDASDVASVNARRTWIIEQLAALVRNGAIPKDDAWVQAILDWFTVHGLFIVRRKSEKSEFLALHSIPSPPFSDDLRKLCRERLLSCLAELTTHATVLKTDDKTVKVPAAASDGRFWISRVLQSIERLEKDGKHLSVLAERDEDVVGVYRRARELCVRLRRDQVVGDQLQDVAGGTELLVSAALLAAYCADADDDDDDDEGEGEEDEMEVLQNCLDGGSRLFPAETKKSNKKGRKPAAADSTAAAENAKKNENEETDEPEPIDVLVDVVIGFLEKGTAYMRAVANQVFALLCADVKESTVDLVLAQLARKDPAELLEDGDEDEEMEGAASDDEDEDEDEDEGEDASDSESSDAEEDEEEEAEAEDPELRRKIEEALRVNGIEPATGDTDDESEEELMDDDQMMAIDEQLAAVFKARAEEKKMGKGALDAQREATHYKNRVLDLVEIFFKKQPTNPHIFRFILPLVELITDTSSDEKQLADKATGILRSRIVKSKETPTEFDRESAIAILEELHVRARKAPSSDVLFTLGGCSLFVSRALVHAGDEESVRKVYSASLVDFVTRKASRLSTGFIQEFGRRYPRVAWGMRQEYIDVIPKAVNAYRQSQVFHLLQVLLSQVFSVIDLNAEAMSFMPVLRDAILNAITKAAENEKSTLTVPHVKDILKLALSAVRQTRRITANLEEVQRIWKPASWQQLLEKLEASSHFKQAKGLHDLCKQVMRTIDQAMKGAAAKNENKKSEDKKRKAEDADGSGEEAEAETTSKKSKRKKVKKNKA